MSEEGIRQLEDLFELGDSDVDLEDVYSEDTGDDTFEDKKEEINDLLQEEIKENGETKKASTKDIIEEAITAPQPVENKEVIIEKETEKVEEKTEDEVVEKPNIVEEESDEEIDFDTTESFKAEESEEEVDPVKIDDFKEEKFEVKDVEDNPFVEGKIEDLEIADKALSEEEIKDKYEETKTKRIVEEPKRQAAYEAVAKMATKEEKMKEQHKTSQSTNHWQLTHPDAKFNHFYKMKKERLEKFLADGEVPYNAWKQELVHARVDLSSLVFDLDHLSKQMQQVQQYQYRVAEIRMAVVGQYNWCKRSLEFLRGKLAQIAYERPIEKFNGVVYDHLSDIEDYLQQLEVLKDNSEIVTKNLDKAAEVISRRVTVVMMEVKTDNKGTRYVPREGEQQDDLGTATVAPMQPANLETDSIEPVKEEDPDDEFLDECDVFEVASSKEEEKPKKKGWDLIPGKK